MRYGGPGFKVSVDSIEPEGGPTTGNTRVLVRGGPFKDLQILYPKPKCKFGRYDMIVDATYVLCTTSPTLTEEREAHHKDKVSAMTTRRLCALYDMLCSSSSWWSPSLFVVVVLKYLNVI